MKVLVAMSGGVDSSTVAHLLSEQGHTVVGVRFTLWTDPLAPAMMKVLPSKCCTTQNISRCATVAKTLGIPLHVVDLTDEFKKTIVDPFLLSHMEGKTPNPCILCNKNIKFGRLLTLMKELGCEKLATGHYARIVMKESVKGKCYRALIEAKDKKKDQSYYLSGLSEKQLLDVLFPLGDLMKSEVYELAKRFNIPLSDSYRESQDLCFFPEKKPAAFLKRYLGDSMREGKIIDREGTERGKHKGLPLYTIGQRHGLGIGGLKVPLEVVAKNSATNELIVNTKGSEKVKRLRLSNISLMNDDASVLKGILSIRTRSQEAKKKGQVTLDKKGATITFHSPSSPVAAGQTAVIYNSEEVLGGGTISEILD